MWHKITLVLCILIITIGITAILWISLIHIDASNRITKILLDGFVTQYISQFHDRTLTACELAELIHFISKEEGTVLLYLDEDENVNSFLGTPISGWAVLSPTVIIGRNVLNPPSWFDLYTSGLQNGNWLSSNYRKSDNSFRVVLNVETEIVKNSVDWRSLISFDSVFKVYTVETPYEELVGIVARKITWTEKELNSKYKWLKE